MLAFISAAAGTTFGGFLAPFAAPSDSLTILVILSEMGEFDILLTLLSATPKFAVFCFFFGLETFFALFLARAALSSAASDRLHPACRCRPSR